MGKWGTAGERGIHRIGSLGKAGGCREGGGLIPEHRAEPRGCAQADHSTEAGGRAEAHGQAAPGGRWRGASGIHQKANDIMLWVCFFGCFRGIFFFFSRMKFADNFPDRPRALGLRGEEQDRSPQDTQAPIEAAQGLAKALFFYPFGLEELYFLS